MSRILFAVMIGLGLGIALGVAYDSPIPTVVPVCATEDSDNCHWDATTQGNGTGRSFTVIDGVVSYE